MLNRIKRLKNSKISSNFISLTFVQITNYIIPLATFPYLVRVLGVERFGLIMFTQSFINYFSTLTDYSFNLSAIREIAINRSDNNKLNTIFNQVINAKVLLCLISFFILLFSYPFIVKLQEETQLVLLSFSVVIGQTFTSTWFFQGIEDMKYITYLNVMGKIISAILIFTLIRVPNDYVLANLFQGLGNICIGIISIYILKSKYDFKFKFLGVKSIFKSLYDGWHVFISNFTVISSISSNVFILGIFTDGLHIGYYVMAEKIFTAFRSVAVILYQAIYPKVCILAQNGFNFLLYFFKKIFLIIGLIFIPGSLFVFIFSNKIIYLIAGYDVPQTAFILRILAFAPLITAFNIPATLTLLAYDLKKSYALVSTFVAVFNIVINLILVSLYRENGTALSSFLTELVMTIALYFTLSIYYKQYSIFKILNLKKEQNFSKI